MVRRFDGGESTSDAGGALLREVERRTGILSRMSGWFEDHRDPERIEHTPYRFYQLIPSCTHRAYPFWPKTP